MKPHEKIAMDFRDLLSKRGESAYKNLKKFFERQKEDFYEAKILELQARGINRQDSIIKARQGWVSVAKFLIMWWELGAGR
ncbi:hypothetical protein CCY99_03315 [Helicobacter sp. 16-1353]|nr:hypothetical protein CCY99_03315 [Helicobacter sp. 16-1353]